MFTEWWKLPMQIAMGLVLAALIQAVAVFILRAISGGKLGASGWLWDPIQKVLLG